MKVSPGAKWCKLRYRTLMKMRDEIVEWYVNAWYYLNGIDARLKEVKLWVHTHHPWARSLNLLGNTNVDAKIYKCNIFNKRTLIYIKINDMEKTLLFSDICYTNTCCYEHVLHICFFITELLLLTLQYVDQNKVVVHCRAVWTRFTD